MDTLLKILSPLFTAIVQYCKLTNVNKHRIYLCLRASKVKYFQHATLLFFYFNVWFLGVPIIEPRLVCYKLHLVRLSLILIFILRTFLVPCSFCASPLLVVWKSFSTSSSVMQLPDVSLPRQFLSVLLTCFQIFLEIKSCFFIYLLTRRSAIWRTTEVSSSVGLLEPLFQFVTIKDTRDVP